MPSNPGSDSSLQPPDYKSGTLQHSHKCTVVVCSDVNKDWTCKDKDNDQAYKDQDKDKD